MITLDTFDDKARPWEVPLLDANFAKVLGQLGLSIAAPDTDASPGVTLPAAASRAGLSLRFDAGGNVIVSLEPMLVPSVAAMRAMIPVANQVITTLGYYGVNLGGSTTYYFDSTDAATDDGFLHIQPNAGGVGRWRPFLGPVVDVKQAGAYGDDAGGTGHDDTAAINAVIQSFSTSGVAYLSPGVYRIASSGSNPAISLRQNVSLVGPPGTGYPLSSYHTRLNYYGTGLGIQAYTAGTPYVGDMSGIELGGFYISDVNGTADKLVDLQGFRWSLCRRLGLSGGNYGLHVFQSWFGRFEDIWAQSFRTTGVWDEAGSNQVRYTRIKVASTLAAVANPAFLLQYATTARITELDSEGNNPLVKIDNCVCPIIDTFYFEGAAIPGGSAPISAAMLLSACTSGEVRNAYISGSSKVTRGIYNGTNSTVTKIRGGRIIGCTTPVDDTTYGKEVDVDGVSSDTAFSFGGATKANRRVGYKRWTARPSTGTGTWNPGDFNYHDSPQTAGIMGYLCTDTGAGGTAAGTHRTVVGARELQFTLEEDFLGGALNTNIWNTTIGTNGSCAIAIDADQLNGALRQTLGIDAGGTMALNGVQLSSGLHWKASAGDFWFEVRLYVNNNASIAVFAGFTNQHASLQMPFTMAAGDNLTANAADACGVFYDTAGTTQHWWGVGAKASSAVKVDLGVQPQASTYETFRIEILSGTAYFYRNGVFVNSLANAITTTAPITPVIAAFAHSNNARYVEIDKFFAGQGRS